MADNIVGNGTFATNLVNQWLDEIAERCWVSLHFDTPASSNYNTEFSITPGGYARQRASFTPADNRVIWLASPLRWRGLSAGVIAYVGGWNSADAGDLLWFDKVTDPVNVANGSSWLLDTNKLAISFA